MGTWPEGRERRLGSNGPKRRKGTKGRLWQTWDAWQERSERRVRCRCPLPYWIRWSSTSRLWLERTKEIQKLLLLKANYSLYSQNLKTVPIACHCPAACIKQNHTREIPSVLAWHGVNILLLWQMWVSSFLCNVQWAGPSQAQYD